MPELPDVANFKQYLDSTSLHRPVEHSTCLDESILRDVSRHKLQRALKGHAFESSRRHGKYLFARIGRGGPHLVFHFGMTGKLTAFRNDDECPRHARFVFRFESGDRLAFVCQRKFGWLSLTDDTEQFLEDRDLGPDALEIGWPAFRDRFADRRGSLKSALMDQSLVAGIGNIYSDEILFQCGWHPRRDTGDLSEEELRELRRTMRRVLRTATRNDAQPAKFPDGYLLAHRRTDGRCPGCGAEFSTAKINSRTAYFCPNCQKM